MRISDWSSDVCSSDLSFTIYKVDSRSLRGPGGPRRLRIMKKTREFHRQSIEQPEEFWGREAKRIHWETPFTKVLDYSNPPFARWFVGGRTNLCYNAVDRWLADRADEPALIWVSTEVEREIVHTRADLAREVNAAARSEEHTSEIQSLMRNSYAVFCLKKKQN